MVRLRIGCDAHTKSTGEFKELRWLEVVLILDHGIISIISGGYGSVKSLVHTHTAWRQLRT